MTDTRIRLFVCDIDGCLSKGSTHSFEPELLQALFDANRLSRTDPDVPAITFCTGRTMPYVECMLQATGGYLPALCENGTVLFEPTRYEITVHPRLGESERDMLQRMRSLIDEKLICEHVQHEQGKFTHFTLLVLPPMTPEEVLPRAVELADQFGDHFIVEPTRMCVHVTFRHIHKGTGIEWLSQTTGIAPSEMAGIGDARPDLPFLKEVAIACAPANAHPDVKALAHWHSQECDARAALQFLDRLVARNREISRSEGHGPASVFKPTDAREKSAS